MGWISLGRVELADDLDPDILGRIPRVQVVLLPRLESGEALAVPGDEQGLLVEHAGGAHLYPHILNLGELRWKGEGALLNVKGPASLDDLDLNGGGSGHGDLLGKSGRSVPEHRTRVFGGDGSEEGGDLGIGHGGLLLVGVQDGHP